MQNQAPGQGRYPMSGPQLHIRNQGIAKQDNQGRQKPGVESAEQACTEKALGLDLCLLPLELALLRPPINGSQPEQRNQSDKAPIQALNVVLQSGEERVERKNYANCSLHKHEKA